MEYDFDENVTKKIKQLHGKNRGNLPFPCGYCYYHNIGIIPITEHKANIVVKFKPDIDPDNGKEIPVFCEGNLNGPTGYGRCDKFAYDDRDVRPHCTDKVFSDIEKDYTMYIISKIYEHGDKGIQRSKMIDRSKKGYHTREKRIESMIANGIIDNVRGRLMLTPKGNHYAMAIRNMYSEIMRIMSIGDLLEYPDYAEVFKKIMIHPDSTADELTDGMTKREKEKFGEMLVALENEGHISSEFDDSYERIVFKVTEAGCRCYARYCE